MEISYNAELRVKRELSPDATGTGPFTRADDAVVGISVRVFKRLLDNTFVMNRIVRSCVDALKKQYALLEDQTSYEGT